MCGLLPDDFSPEGFSVFGCLTVLGLVVLGFGFPFGAFEAGFSSSGPCSVASVDSTESEESTDSMALSEAMLRTIRLESKLRTKWESFARSSVPADGIGAASAPLSSAATRMERKAIVKEGRVI